MARWKLLGKHYINVEGTEWEYEETTATGKRHKMRLPVPLFLDPDETEHRNRDGDIVVATAGSAQQGDLVFSGIPSPEMEPLDDEARKITDEHRSKWVNAIESLPSTVQTIAPAARRPA